MEQKDFEKLPMNMPEIRYYNILWCVSEDESEETVTIKIWKLLLDIFPDMCPDKFTLIDVRKEAYATVTIEGFVITTFDYKRMFVNIYFTKKSCGDPYLINTKYKVANILQFAEILSHITYLASMNMADDERLNATPAPSSPYVSEISKAANAMNRASKAYTECVDRLRRTYKNALNSLYGSGKLKSMVRSITINEKKKVTTVVFKDGDVQMAKCSKNDEYDKVVGISICVAAHFAGSKEKLKKFVKEELKND